MPTSTRDLATTPPLVLQGLRTWTRRHAAVAVAATIVVAVVVGTATVLIPNPVFGREIAPVWWNYPVWLLTSALSGMLAATYVRTNSTSDGVLEDESARRSSRLGLAGGVLAWFAVGCPVCNKLALLALGYSGAISYFAPLQPVLAVAALVVTGVALMIRLRNQARCPLPRRSPAQ